MQRSVVTRTGVLLKDLHKDIADQLVATTWWAKPYDNSANKGDVIISPTQTFKYRTSTGNQIDNGATWQADGKPYRYQHPNASGEEYAFMKMTPYFTGADVNANQWYGFWLQASNALNVAGDNLRYDNNGNGGLGSPVEYKDENNNIVTTTHTSNWRQRVFTTNRGVSPTNTNSTYFSAIRPFANYENPTTATLNYKMFVYHNADVLYSKNRCDYVLLILWGDGANGYTRVVEFGVPPALVDWYGEGFGAARFGFGDSVCYGAGGQNAGLAGMSVASVSMPNNLYEWGAYTMNNNAMQYQYIQCVLPDVPMQYMAGGRFFSATPSTGNNNAPNFVYQNGFTKCDDSAMHLVSNPVKYPFFKCRHLVVPMPSYYYAHGTASANPTNNGYDPIAELPYGNDVYVFLAQNVDSLLGTGARTNDTVEYAGKRYMLVKNTNQQYGYTSVQTANLVYLEDIV